MRPKMDETTEKLVAMAGRTIRDTIIYLEDEVGLNVAGIELSHFIDPKTGELMRKMEMFFANPADGETKQ